MTASLSAVEQLAVTVCRTINERPATKAAQRVFLERFGAAWVDACTRNLQRVHGLDVLRALEPQRGVLLCANHRSFFDLYVIAAIMWKAKLPWNRRHYYPVRSTFFYESLAGLGVNLLMGGGAMYPPIFRDPARSALTRASVDKLIALLDEPGVVVGVHPEGTRGKGPDPYQLLPAQPGIGQMALRSSATVIPVWIRGLGNELIAQIAGNFARAPRRGPPIHVWFGPPVDLSHWRRERARASVYVRASRQILAAIADLGARERALSAGGHAARRTAGAEDETPARRNTAG